LVSDFFDQIALETQKTFQNPNPKCYLVFRLISMEPPIQKNDDDVTTAIITAAAAPGLGKMKKNTKRKRLAGKAVIVS